MIATHKTHTAGEPLLDVQNLRKSFRAASQLGKSAAGSPRIAVGGVSFQVHAGETLGIAGESGCGKTTLARLLLRLIASDSGSIRFAGMDWLSARGRALRAGRREMQLVFQDPGTSLDPRMRVEEMLAEPLAIHELGMAVGSRRPRVVEMLEAVGMGSEALGRYPHEFSGGQRQRLSIARALMLRPALLVADEPVASLDVSVGAQVLDLMQRLKLEFGMTLILISHSLPVVAQMADRVAVMQEGRFVEIGRSEKVLRSPQHAYTKELLQAVPALPPFEALPPPAGFPADNLAKL